MEYLDDRLAASLSVAVTQSPRANLQQLATQAGISKATLYRICSTREGLIELLTAQATMHMQHAISNSFLDTGNFRQALLELTRHILHKKELYLFWCSSLWMDLTNTRCTEVSGYRSSFYSRRLEEFFLSGQRAGYFRIDLTASWLAKSFDFLVYAAAESSLRGEIGTVGLEETVEKTFLFGAVTQ